MSESEKEQIAIECGCCGASGPWKDTEVEARAAYDSGNREKHKEYCENR